MSFSQMQRFFWICSGTPVHFIEKYSTEHSKYLGIGATIVFTALFAGLSGGYALYFVFAGNPYAPLWSVLFGLLWGLAIFNLDRYIVSSISKTSKGLRQFWPVFQARGFLRNRVLSGQVGNLPQGGIDMGKQQFNRTEGGWLEMRIGAERDIQAIVPPALILDAMYQGAAHIHDCLAEAVFFLTRSEVPRRLVQRDFQGRSPGFHPLFEHFQK